MRGKYISKTCNHCGSAFERKASNSDGAKFCSRKCQASGRLRCLKSRFWEKVEKTEECWLWTGHKYTTGYGCISLGPRGSGVAAAHRLSYEWAFGEIPEGMQICHKCDVRHCVRPDHLFAGTNADNCRDKAEKGRAPKAESHWTHRMPERIARGNNSGMRRHPEVVKRGIDSSASKLTEVEVITIRSRYAAGGVRQWQLAEEFGTTQSTIHKIVTRQRWKHLG